MDKSMHGSPYPSVTQPMLFHHRHTLMQPPPPLSWTPSRSPNRLASCRHHLMARCGGLDPAATWRPASHNRSGFFHYAWRPTTTIASVTATILGSRAAASAFATTGEASATGVPPPLHLIASVTATILGSRAAASAFATTGEANATGSAPAARCLSVAQQEREKTLPLPSL
uniref:Uncharacterized protein n=1 Tax=Oryza glaberrima TaxID=4538 RepID=A0A679BDC3_ORYGL|nr:hypothetical protein [Oryza glaberrima]